MAIKIDVSEKSISVGSPYHPEFPKHAKNLGGRWDSSKRVWIFDPRDEDSIRDLCLDLFGDDGRGGSVKTVDVRVRISGAGKQSFWFAGREIAKRPSRDWDVKLGAGVVLVEGEFRPRGGSSKYPSVFAHGESVLLEVRDVPLALALREQEANPDDVTILGGEPEMLAMVSIGVKAETMDALREELSAMSGGDDEIVAVALEAFLNR